MHQWRLEFRIVKRLDKAMIKIMKTTEWTVASVPAKSRSRCVPEVMSRVSQQCPAVAGCQRWGRECPSHAPLSLGARGEVASVPGMSCCLWVPEVRSWVFSTHTRQRFRQPKTSCGKCDGTSVKCSWNLGNGFWNFSETFGKADGTCSKRCIWRQKWPESMWNKLVKKIWGKGVERKGDGG